ncbi:MAG TPA: DUF2695 domain-containing protein [Gaiellaceae bacterium]|nr:DUF2695 domain-containing protein [Gaiellaceae bacterium]
MPLDSDQLDNLLGFLRENDAEERRDQSFRLTKAWAAENGVDREPLVDAPHEFGGYCDCEVLANVDPRFANRFARPSY